jgi:predicted transcriptional regulator of viral defense system
VKLTEAHRRLLGMPSAYFTTNDAATLLDIDSTHASKVLDRLGETSHVVRLARGRWAFPESMTPFALPEALTFPMPSYVSLYSALYHYSMIEQIPTATYAITLAPTRRVRTPLGAVSLHQVAPAFFTGFAPDRTGSNIALPEKALLDVLYLHPTRSRRFRALPELHLPPKFNRKQARRLAAAIESPQRRTLVLTKLEDILRRTRAA